MTLAILSLEETENPSKREFRLVASPVALRATSPRYCIKNTIKHSYNKSNINQNNYANEYSCSSLKIPVFLET